MAICHSLSHVDQARQGHETTGGQVILCQCVSKALLSGKEEKSFEVRSLMTTLVHANSDFQELRLEDQKILADPEIKSLIYKRNPHLAVFGRTLTSQEVENWCRRFMATSLTDAMVGECSPQ